MRKKDVALLFGPALLLLFFLALWGENGERGDGAGEDAPNEVHAVDIRVVDGDTIEWQGTNYRLEGFDAPETLQAECEAERAMGEATSAMLRSLILGADQIEIQPQQGTDKYGRGIARLLIDGENVGERLVAQRLARPYDQGTRQPWCD